MLVIRLAAVTPTRGGVIMPVLTGSSGVIPMDEPSQPQYSESSFWDKLKKYALTAGADVVEKALQLFYALQSPTTPKWAKTIIVGALAYFIMPADAIPDVIAVVGYTDDLGALAAAISTVGMYITDDSNKIVKAKMEQWFGKKGADTDGVA